MRFDCPGVAHRRRDPLSITHEHDDHSAADRIGGDPPVIRSTSRFDTAFGRLVTVASTHDAVAGTRRGPSTIFGRAFGEFAICDPGDAAPRHDAA